MPIVTETCITIDCDTPGCRAQAGEEDGGTHFPDLTAGEYYLDGWRIAPDGTVTCARCVRAEQCRAGQHDWASRPSGDGVPGERWCRYCDAETALLAADEPER